MTRYAHASNKLLGIQIDAAINPGIAASLAPFIAAIGSYCVAPVQDHAVLHV